MIAPRLKALLLLSLTGTLIACGSDGNPDRQAPPELVSYQLVQGEETKTIADPKVNILFVVDNSGSMKEYQERMAKNIELFANRFFENSRIDYRIGVVPVYDRKYLNDTVEYRSGLRKMNPLGELVPLKGVDPKDTKSQLYITRETLNPKEVLKKTVAIGVQWGPEAEESYSPVIAVMDEKINREKNQNFYDPEAYLAIIFLTDADDVTLDFGGDPGVSGAEFYKTLVRKKGGDRSKVLIAAALPNIAKRNQPGCGTDGAGPIQSFPALLAISGGIWADLCSDRFGEDLAKFGKVLHHRVAAQRISLGFTPDIREENFYVSYGTPDSKEEDRIKIERGPKGYFFDSGTNEVVLSEELRLPRIENGIIFVRAIPANLGNAKNGRLEIVK